MTIEQKECPLCGSSPADREARRAQYPDDNIPVELTSCPHCGSAKCSMCDMGDDVSCMGCEGGDHDH